MIEVILVLSAATIFVIFARRLPEVDGEDIPIDKTYQKEKKVGFSMIDLGRGIKNKIDFSGFKKIGSRFIHSRVEKQTKIAFKTVSDLVEEADDFFTAGDLKSSEKLYLKAAAKDPRNVKIYSRLGTLYLKQDNFADARDALLAALNIDNTVATRHYNLSLAYSGLHAREKAKVAIKKAIDIDPENQKYQKVLERLEQKA